LELTPDASANDVAAAASSASRMDISPGLVYAVKASMGGTKKKARRKKKKVAAKRAAPKETSPVQDMGQAAELMLQAVDLVMKAGYKEAKSMIEVAGKMVDRIAEK
jgi:hypothetical protein